MDVLLSRTAYDRSPVCSGLRNLEAWTGGRDMENVLTLEHLESAGAGGDIPARGRRVQAPSMANPPASRG